MSQKCSKLEHGSKGTYERGAGLTMKKRKSHLHRTTKKPRPEKLSWPGLRAKDRLTRVVTRAVKEAREARENEIQVEHAMARFRKAALKLLKSRARAPTG
jgi:hypothetical protein